MIAYKGTNFDMTCRGFQYELNKEYTATGQIAPCKNGFHACPNPLDAFFYYKPESSRYFLVEQSDEIIVENSVQVSRKIKLLKELSIQDLAEAARLKDKHNNITLEAEDTTPITLALSNVTQNVAITKQCRGVAIAINERAVSICDKEAPHTKAAITTDSNSIAVSSSSAITLGINSVSHASNFYSKAVCIDYNSAAIAEHDNSYAIALGSTSSALVKGQNSVAAALGGNSIVTSGPIGSAIFSLTKNADGTITSVGSAIVDGIKVKPFTTYHLVDGEFVEVKMLFTF